MWRELEARMGAAVSLLGLGGCPEGREASTSLLGFGVGLREKRGALVSLKPTEVFCGAESLYSWVLLER